MEIASSEALGKDSREALARKLFEFEEEKTLPAIFMKPFVRKRLKLSLMIALSGEKKFRHLF